MWDIGSQNQQQLASGLYPNKIIHAPPSSYFYISNTLPLPPPITVTKREEIKEMASSVRKASWIVATSMAAVEALKDQVGLCRWNYAIRSLHQHAKNSLGPISQAKRRMYSASYAAIDRLKKERIGDQKARQSEDESLRKVMYISCWGPN